jgi:hypothetical protein
MGQGWHGAGGLATGSADLPLDPPGWQSGIGQQRITRMRKLFVTIAAAIVAVPLPAAALECLEYSVQSSYWWHKEQPETYILANGLFTDVKRMKTVASRTTADAFVPGRAIYSAKFEGFRASRRAFDQPFTAEVTLVFPDYSFMGGGYDTSSYLERLPGSSGLVWLQEDGSRYQVTADLCMPLIDTDPASVKPALRCLRGGHCPK